MIKIEHSIFALPFAFVGALIAARGIPEWSKIGWITLAMISARSVAMGLNRVIDRKIDAANPRTKNREIPSGVIRVGETTVFIAVSLVVLIYSAYSLNPLCLWLSPVAISVLVLYSYTKRFTWGSHFVLGLAIAGAPLGAWIAVTGSFDPRILALGFAVVFWLAGFDTLYALQDMDFDRSFGLRSIPQQFGVAASIRFAQIAHVIAWCFLALVGFLFNLSPFYWIGLFFVAALFFYEHSLVKKDDLSKLNMAFFNMNGYISMTVFVFTLLGYI